MSEKKKLQPPLTETDVRSLKAGNEVLITGEIYTARDMAHKRLFEAIEAGRELPFPLEGAIIYFVGPTPARPGRVIGAAGPTTSSRMDAFSPKLLANGISRRPGQRCPEKIWGCSSFYYRWGGGAIEQAHCCR